MSLAFLGASYMSASVILHVGIILIFASKQEAEAQGFRHVFKLTHELVVK